MAEPEGTDNSLEGCSDWYILTEAECKDDNNLDEMFEASDNESFCSDLVDNAAVEQGNSLELFQRQEFQAGLEQIQQLKRKYDVRSPVRAPKPAADVAELSPQLQKISITPQKKTRKGKKKLFEPEDSGIATNEADDTNEELQVEKTFIGDASGTSSLVMQSTPFPNSALCPEPGGESEGGSGVDVEREGGLPALTGRDAVQALMKNVNYRATILAKFKTCFGCSFHDLTRSFKSNKTMSKNWCLAIFGVRDQNVKHAEELLRQQCEFIYFEGGHANCVAGLLELKNQKCRDTVIKLLKTTMNIEEIQVLAEPPRVASTVSALFWYQRCTKDGANAFGSLPLWVIEQCSLQHRQGYEKQFDLSEMIQWAFDNDYLDESTIAYQYAIEAEVKDNARAFLKHPSQAKIVRDCATMVKHYKRAEMRNTSMSRWIFLRCSSNKDAGDEWKQVANFLRLQGIQLYRFVGAMQLFLQGKPKKSCLVFHGPPDTGKSLFAMSLISFLGGKVITFANSTSHFWLSPLIDAKAALLDDATLKCWQYFDVYLRGALDGNVVCLDSKHRAPIQVRFPPMLITTNVDVKKEDGLKFLYSRLQFFHFPEVLPIQTSGEPRYLLNDQSWRSFFLRFWVTLALSDQEEDDDGAAGTLRLHTRTNTGTV
uniref:Replication protein E1 n=1 Tax=Plecotus austriacus papillomavirus 1 TaxID=3140011 RepID=A0AAU6S4T9_9PAPI